MKSVFMLIQNKWNGNFIMLSILIFSSPKLRGCLVNNFIHMFSVFKQYYKYFHTYVFTYIFLNNKTPIFKCMFQIPPYVLTFLKKKIKKKIIKSLTLPFSLHYQNPSNTLSYSYTSPSSMDSSPQGYSRNVGICLINPSKKVYYISHLSVLYMGFYIYVLNWYTQCLANAAGNFFFFGFILM